MHTGRALAGILPLVPRSIVWAVAKRYVAGPTIEDALRVTTELERRLRTRATETEEKLRRRLAKAGVEIADAAWFDHVVVNDDPDEAAAQVAAILAESPDDGDVKDVP